MAGLTVALLGIVSADFYMHNPAGGNDRNRERNQNRNNDNRLFDSQNNGNGGYPWRGDRELQNAADPMIYYEGSTLAMDWTLQHACGNDVSTYCQVVIQYACTEYGANGQPLAAGPNSDDRIGVANSAGLRDGYPSGALADAGGNNGADNAVAYQKATFTQNGNAAGTNTIPFDANNAAASTETEFGMHETYGFYKACTEQQRNKGLYTADQNLNKNDARSTRQNPNGNRRGLECPEERDYYPSWHASPWKDAAILTSSEEFCPYFQANSQNTVDRNYCTGAAGAQDNRQPIDQNGCSANGGTWNTAQSWAGQGYAIGAPECKMHAASRQNHLGNAAGAYDVSGAGEKETMASYDFAMPTMKTGVDHMMCVLRARYNISTNDYPSVAGMMSDGTQVYAQSDNCAKDRTNTGDNTGTQVDQSGQTGGSAVDNAVGPGGDPVANCINTASGARPLYNRPYITPWGANEADLGIALNTDQSGRTFQDRSYVFKVAKRPAGVSASANIVNLNTRGARGNIVQAYPRVEYDWAPGDMKLATSDLVHLQWSGSDFNTQRNPNNAEGWQYADRSNMVESLNENQQFPMNQAATGFFSYAESLEVGLQGQDALLKAKGLTTGCGEYTDNTNNEDNNPSNCGKLNFAKAHFQIGGNSGTGLKSMSDKKGTYSFVDTRNNNFSNRSQKMQIEVGEPKSQSSWEAFANSLGGEGVAITGIVLFAIVAALLAVALVAGLAVVGFLAYNKYAKGTGADGELNVEMGSRAGPPAKPGKKGAPAKPTRVA